MVDSSAIPGTDVKVALKIFLHFVSCSVLPPEKHPQYHEIEFYLTHKSKLSYIYTPKKISYQ
jgi:hypothetical protein